MDKAAWKDVKSALDSLTARREDMIRDIKIKFEKERDHRWAKTQKRYDSLVAKLAEIEGELGEPFGYCEGCGEPLFDGDRHHVGTDVYLCEPCSPTFADMAAHPENFGDTNDDPMTADAAQAICAAHVAAGGQLTDHIV